MTTQGPDPGADATAKVAPETLELRARPQPVTRINRRVLIGAAAVVLFFISAIVLVALKPPSLRIGERPELFNVDHKPITDGLSKLPATLRWPARGEEDRRGEAAAGHPETDPWSPGRAR